MTAARIQTVTSTPVVRLSSRIWTRQRAQVRMVGVAMRVGGLGLHHVNHVVQANIKPRLHILEQHALHALVALSVKNKQHNVQHQLIVYVEIVMQVNIKPCLHILEQHALHALVAVLVKNKQHNVQRPQMMVYVEIVMQVYIKPRLHLLEPVALNFVTKVNK